MSKEHPPHLIVLRQLADAPWHWPSTQSCISPMLTVQCTCLVLRHDQQRRRVNFRLKSLSSSILGWLGQNFTRLSKKIRPLGRHISLKIYEPGGTNLKILQYKKIFVVKNRKRARLPVLTVVSIGRRKWPAGTKNKTLETLKRIRIGIFRILTSHIQWHKLEFVSC